MDTPITTATEFQEALAEIKSDWQNADQRDFIDQANIAASLERLEARCNSESLRVQARVEITLFDERCDELNDTGSGW